MPITFARDRGVRLVFLWVGALGLVANLVMDLEVHRRATEAGQARFEREAVFQRIMHSFRVENALRDRDARRARELLAATGDVTERGSILTDLDQNDWEGARRRVRELRLLDEQALTNNFSHDDQRWRSHIVVRTLTVDVALIAMLIGLGLIDYRARERTERLLRHSVQQMRAVVRGGEEKLRQLRVKNRTLVHNLKNPVGSIMGFAELIREESPNASSVEQHSAVIERLSKSALRQVEALLAEDAPSEIPPRTPFDPARLVHETVEHLRGLAHAKRQEIVSEVHDLSGVAHGAPGRIAEVLSNLIGNAIKYSPPGATVWVRARPYDGGVEIVVEDEGPGFAPEDLPRAFGYGTTLSARPTGGEAATGFGLYVAKQIVDQHGGRIAIGTGRGGRGARVTFSIPRDASRALSV